MSQSDAFRPIPTVSVYRAEHFRVVNGANLGDGMGLAEELTLDDTYRLMPLARLEPLALVVRGGMTGGGIDLAIASTSLSGRAGAAVHLDCCVTFMSRDGRTVQALVMVETEADGDVADIYLLPLAPLDARTDHALVGISTDTMRAAFAQLACASFTRGTLITMAGGAQRPIEELKIGDRILTRDDGPQTLRWIGKTTTRALGEFAPIQISAGTLHNLNDLTVSPDHRLFIYQRTDRIGAGRAELLIKARHLVNGTTVRRLSGGFVDYFQMLFDHHQIVYAEGIAAESMLADGRTSAALPQDLDISLSALLPAHGDLTDLEIEVQERLLQRPDVTDLLRRSSRG